MIYNFDDLNQTMKIINNFSIGRSTPQAPSATRAKPEVCCLQKLMELVADLWNLL
jgi:hypothetical protein